MANWLRRGFHKASDKAGLDAAGDGVVAAIELSMRPRKIRCCPDIIGKVCGTEKKPAVIEHYNDKLRKIKTHRKNK